MDSNLVILRLEYKRSVLYRAALAVHMRHGSALLTSPQGLIRASNSCLLGCYTVSEHIVLDAAADRSASVFRISHGDEDSTVRNLWKNSPSDVDHIPRRLESSARPL
jgi:hypothetical protein